MISDIAAEVYIKTLIEENINHIKAIVEDTLKGFYYPDFKNKVFVSFYKSGRYESYNRYELSTYTKDYKEIVYLQPYNFILPPSIINESDNALLITNFKPGEHRNLLLDIMFSTICEFLDYPGMQGFSPSLWRL